MLVQICWQNERVSLGGSGIYVRMGIIRSTCISPAYSTSSGQNNRTFIKCHETLPFFSSMSDDSIMAC